MRITMYPSSYKLLSITPVEKVSKSSWQLSRIKAIGPFIHGRAINISHGLFLSHLDGRSYPSNSPVLETSAMEKLQQHTRDQPRILCIHGGGASAQILCSQMRYLAKQLQDDVRCVFVDGPWISEKHSALEAAFPHMSPCYRWARWLEEQPPLENESATNEVEIALMNAMADDEGTGEWIGLLGFSQGAKMAFSILLENSLRARENRMVRGYAGIHWRFGIIMAGGGQPFTLSSLSRQRKGYTTFTQLPYHSNKSVYDNNFNDSDFSDRLQTPTLHIHGMRDEGLKAHRDLLASYTIPEHARLIEWDGDHRLPVKSEDVRKVAEAIKEIVNSSLKMKIQG